MVFTYPLFSVLLWFQSSYAFKNDAVFVQCHSIVNPYRGHALPWFLIIDF